MTGLVEREGEVGGDAERVRGELGEADLRGDGEALDQPAVCLRQVALRHRDAREREAHVRDAVAVAEPPRRPSSTPSAVDRASAGSPVCSYDSARFPEHDQAQELLVREQLVGRPAVLDARLRIAGRVRARRARRGCGDLQAVLELLEGLHRAQPRRAGAVVVARRHASPRSRAARGRGAARRRGRSARRLLEPLPRLAVARGRATGGASTRRAAARPPRRPSRARTPARPRRSRAPARHGRATACRAPTTGAGRPPRGRCTTSSWPRRARRAPRLLELGERVRPDRLEHREARLGAARERRRDEARVEERVELGGDVRAGIRGRLERVEGRPARIEGEHGEHVPRGRVEEAGRSSRRSPGATAGARGGRARSASGARAPRRARRAVPSTPSTRTRAAASSIARGSPSRRRVMRATLSAFSAVSSNSGTDSRARSTYSRTAAVDEIASRSVAVGSGTSSGGTRYSCSLVRRSGTRLVARIPSDRHRREQRAELRERAGQVLEVVDDDERRAVRPSRVRSPRQAPRPPAPRGRARRADRGEDAPPGRSPTSRSTSGAPPSGAAAASASVVLPVPPGPVSVTSRVSSAAEERGDGGELERPPDHVGVRRGRCGGRQLRDRRRERRVLLEDALLELPQLRRGLEPELVERLARPWYAASASAWRPAR